MIKAMFGRIIRLAVGIVTLSAMLSGVVACGGPAGPEYAAEPEYAGPITEDMLLAINEND